MPADWTQGKDFNSAVCLSLVNGVECLNKFGRSSNVDAAKTDIWDGANATDDIKIYVAPTEARIHEIVSSDAGDDSAGAGARTLRLYGLKTWEDTEEAKEDIIMDGTTAVDTVNSYVFIYRMKVLTHGATSINIGQIKATAKTDSSISAIITALAGQTQMAIFAIPSTKTLMIDSMHASLNKSATGVCDMTLLVNDNPDDGVLNTFFKVKHTEGASASGSSSVDHEFTGGKRVDGPAIIKLQGLGSTVNLDVDANFDGKIFDKAEWGLENELAPA